VVGNIGRWKYRFAGKEKRLAFGVYPDVTLKMAREKRDSACQLNREIILRASDREVNAPEETHLEVVRHVAAVRPTPRRWIDVRAVI
jgi:Arm DNA-binding domain